MTDIELFAACVFEPTDIIELRFLPKAESQFVTAQRLTLLNGSLTRQNETQNIYVGANPRTAKGGTKTADVSCARCLFVDFDNMSVQDVTELLASLVFPKPTLILNSGHGVHAYFRLTEPITDLSEWTQYQKRLIATLNSDKSIHDPPRIMRLPSFTNHKQPVAQSKVIYGVPDRRHLLADIEENLVSLEPEPAQQPAQNTQTNTLSKIGRATLAAAKWPPASQGERDNEAFRHAAYLVKDFELSEAEAWPIMVKWNMSNNPPIDEKDLRKKLQSGAKYGKHPAGQSLNKPQVKERKTNPTQSQDLIDKPLIWESAKDILPEKIEWFWDNKIPSGALTIIAGDPGSGKSYLSNYMAALVSRGGEWPDDTGRAPKGDILLIGDEDDPAKVIVPRLISHKADLSKIKLISGVQSEGYFDLSLDINKLRATIKGLSNCKLIILDPITAYLGKTNANSNAEVRAALGPLSLLAIEQNLTIIGINHFNKKQGESFIYRGLGSTAFVAQARSAWGVMTDADDRDEKIFCLIKSNYCNEPTGLKFRIVDVDCPYGAGAVQFSADPWMGHIDDTGDKKAPGRIEDACEWLTERLGTAEVASAEIFDDAMSFGFGKDLIYRAKRKLDLSTRKTGFDSKTAEWFWSLRDEE